MPKSIKIKPKLEELPFRLALALVVRLAARLKTISAPLLKGLQTVLKSRACNSITAQLFGRTVGPLVGPSVADCVFKVLKSFFKFYDTVGYFLMILR